nr:GMC oxidoreductase [Mangrovicoccus ximenensis]
MTSQFLPGGKVEIDPLPGISGACVLVHPDSRGELRTASPDPMADPEFHPNYLDDPGDVRRLISGIRLMRKVLGAAPIATRIEAELAPGTGLETDEALEGYIRGSGGTSWHPVGTCKMGRDPMAVVDPRLRVHGIAGLRVADASVMPRIIGGNTHAPTVMIAEKAADLVRGETGRA